MRASGPGSRSTSWLRPLPVWISLTWGLAESTFFFIIPDIILGWACLTGWRNGLRSLTAILVGSMIGGLVMYGFAATSPEQANSFVASIPFVRDWMFGTVSAAYRDHGAIGMLYGPSSGIPYKVYAVLAPPQFDALTFAILSVPARLERLFLSWLGFTLAGLAFRRWFPSWHRLPVIVFVVVWVAVYATYWSSI